ncbi:MAG TPA: amino acid permease, partial [Thermoanaerobaculia bacterium]
VHPRHRVPVASLWAQTAWAVVLVFTGTYEQLYTYVTFAVILMSGGAVAAGFVLRRTRPDHPRPYRTWGYPLVPALFLGTTVLLVANTLWEKPVESLVGLGLLLLGLPAYAVFRRRNRRTV